MLLLSATLWAQDIRVTGKVTDSMDGSTLPGVTILVKGTTQGTITDSNGDYSITVNRNATLVFSFMGMVAEEVAVNGRNIINVAMMPDVEVLQEFVVVGYGVMQKRDVSGSIASISGDAIKTIPIQSFDQALQGKAAGVNMTQPNALLGNPPVIRIRGFNSISGSSSPLIIVDGIPIFTGEMGRTSAAVNPLADINPSDIESIDVLKDASATAIYGSRAANGVIIITTRRGKEGDLKVNYDVSTGWSSPYRLYNMANAEQYVHIKNTARANAGLADAYFLAYDSDGKLIDTNWADYVYRTGFQHSHSLNISGGTSKTSYMFGANYSNIEGILKTNDYERKGARMNIDHKATKWLSFGANVNYTNTFINSPSSGSLPGGQFHTSGAGRLAFVTAPNVPAFLEDGSYNINWDGNTVGRLENLQNVGFFHPVYLQDHNYANSQGDRIIGTVNSTLNLFKGLYFRTVFGIDYNNLESKQFWNAEHGDGVTRGGDVFNYFDRRNRWNWTNTLNYMFTAAEKLNVNMLIGSEEQHTTWNGWSAWRSELGDPFYRNFQGTWVTEMAPPSEMLFEDYFVSYFGRLNINWASKYYLEFNGRRDGYSGLAAGNKFGNFGGASIMWNISNEGFFKESNVADIISDLRLKTSYGKVGNIDAVSAYASLSLYSGSTYNNESTLYFDQAGNADLRWETSKKFDVGLAFGLLRDKMQFEIGYYHNNIDGLVLLVPQSPSKGIPGNVLPMNIGSMFNKGLEFSLTSFNYATKDFSWTTNFNLTYLKNEVTALTDDTPYLTGGNSLETSNITMVGYPIGMIWGVQTVGVCPDTGRRMFLRLNEDGTTTVVYYGFGNAAAWAPIGENLHGWREADGTISRPLTLDEDGVPLGSPIPKYYGGLDNTFIFKNWDLGIGLTYAYDFVIYNGTVSGLRDHRAVWNYEEYVYNNYWREPGQETDIPRPVWGDNISNGNTFVQSQNVERGDFLKVRNLSLGYTMKNELLKRAEITSVRLYVQVFNAYTFTNYSGADPEISSMGDANLAPGVDRNTIPQARTIAVGLNVSF